MTWNDRFDPSYSHSAARFIHDGGCRLSDGAVHEILILINLLPTTETVGWPAPKR